MGDKARVPESISVICPSCGVTVFFRPVLTGVEVYPEPASGIEPFLRVVLQTGYAVAHICEK